MSTLFFSSNRDISVGSYRIWVNDLSQYFNELGIRAKIYTDNSDFQDCDTIIVGKSDALITPTLRQSFPNKKIGVIGTVATIKSGAYRHALKSIDNNINVFSKDCPLFVPFVEEGMIEGEAINLIVEHYLSSFQNNIDTMILGCTHYPLLEPVIKKYVKGIKLVDSASAVAKHADKILNNYKIKNGYKKRGSLDCFVTDLPRQFEKLGRIFLGESINEPQLVDGF